MLWKTLLVEKDKKYNVCIYGFNRILKEQNIKESKEIIVHSQCRGDKFSLVEIVRPSKDQGLEGMSMPISAH